MKRRPRRSLVGEQELRSRWRIMTVGATCRVCGSGIDVEGHHVVPKRYVKRACAERGLDLVAYLWDLRNWMPLCDRHHNRHETALQRVPRAMVSEDADEFARELGLGWLLDRQYAD